MGNSVDLTGNALNQVTAVPINSYALVKRGIQHDWLLVGFYSTVPVPRWNSFRSLASTAESSTAGP